MKINKNQALYKALPGSWITYSDSQGSDYKYACQVISWNHTKVNGINEEMLKNDITRRIKSFVAAGGEADDNLSPESIESFAFVEPSLIEDIPDIVCKINPNTFYCEKCGKVHYLPNATSSPKCPKCNIKMKQLGMVYGCECGYAEGVKPPTKEELFYHSKDKDSQFKFYTLKGAKREMELMCPVCKKKLFPSNATDHRLFSSQSGSLVNLFNEKYSQALSTYKTDAELLMLAKWYGIITNEEFHSILDNPKTFFEPKTKDVNDPEVLMMAKAFGFSPEEVIERLSANEGDVLSIGKIKREIDNNIPMSKLGEKLKIITSDLIEYDTLKYAKSVISLDSAIAKGKAVGTIIDDNDVYELLNKMSISNIQVSEAVQIVNYAYGFTRMRSCPDAENMSRPLKIKGFGGKAYTTILETEGILVEFDMLKIFKWLVDNDLVSKEIELTSKEEAKIWFLENVNLESITHFSTISGQGDNRITKALYSLLHTISHMMIISAGKHSGLSRDSISELIFPETCSIFIYPTTSEGVTLGSISGMFETELLIFLEDALKDNEVCTFDPVCSTNQNGACVACTYLSEVNCTHFNKDLSRSYLYGGTIKINDDEIKIKKGFWK